eukprot:3972410-Heterocapsa_arctica.AAC.1
MPRGVIPTHRPVKLTLRLAGLREPVDTLWKPRSFVDKFPERESHQRADSKALRACLEGTQLSGSHCPNILGQMVTYG